MYWSGEGIDAIEGAWTQLLAVTLGPLLALAVALAVEQAQASP